MPGDLRLFIPITKVDIENRLVYGIATAEAPDLAGEVCHYATTKPNYEKWSSEVHKASGGKSVGALRSMHGSTAAGKLVDIAFNDDARQIEICGKVVDDNEWKKVQEGVYTGFSQGGRYMKRWADEASGLTYYTADPTEVSLVDMPCLPSATFSVVKADGVVEKRAFTTVIDEPDHKAIKKEAEALAAKAGAGKTWREFAEAATANLFKAAMVSALNKLAPLEEPTPKTEDSAPQAEKTGGKAEKRFNPVYEGKWNCGCADHSHAKQHEAVACMKKRAFVATEVENPVSPALEKLEAELGIAKAKKEPPKITAADVAAAHADAAKAHMGAAELHEAMAAKDDTSADDAETHLTAAAAHRRAAKAHMRASDMHASGDKEADDATKKAGALTDDAAAKSDAMFMDKALAATTLAKYSADEARDSDGRWTGGGSSADAARSKAESVTHALGASAFAMGVGEIGSRAGAAIGGKVGHYAGKAIALAATKSSAASEGGAAVGEKIGRVAGSVIGRMYGESRAWQAVATKASEFAMHAVGAGAGKMRKDAAMADDNEDSSKWNAEEEHKNAASAHRKVASAHMELAAASDTPPEDQEKHLLAAKANLLAAQKHDLAVKGGADETKTAQDFTNQALETSQDALGFTKSARGDMAKGDAADEARDKNGEWTVGGVASAAFHGALGAGAGFVTGDVPGAIAGGIAGANSKSALGALANGATFGGVGALASHALGIGAASAARSAMRSSVARNVMTEGARRTANAGMGMMFGGVKGAVRGAMASKGAGVFERMRKGLSTVGRLANLLQDLYWVQQDVTFEAASEKDGSPIPAALQTVITSLSGLLVQMAQEETGELFKPSAGDTDTCALACARMPENDIAALIKFSKGVPELTKLGKALEETEGEAVNRTIERFVSEARALVKIGARNSKADASKLQQAHDLLADLGAECGKDGGDDGDDDDDVEKLKVENAGLRKSMDDVNLRLATVLEKVAEIGKRAAPAKAVLRAFDKTGDNVASVGAAKPSSEQVAEALKALPEADRAMVLMKLSLMNPVKPIQ